MHLQMFKIQYFPTFILFWFKLNFVFLGGGLGGTRRGGPEENIRHSGRVDQWERYYYAT